MHSDGTGNHHLTAPFANSAGDQAGTSKPTAAAAEAGAYSLPLFQVSLSRF
jgi:hypothetical protein